MVKRSDEASGMAVELGNAEAEAERGEGESEK